MTQKPAMFTGRRNVLLLAASQALMLSAIVLSMSPAAILGALLAPDKSLATLPVAAMVIGTAIASLPAAMLMRRLGRRAGFLMGAGLGVAGSAVAGCGLWQDSFALFVLGHLLLGSYQGFANYNRFAAAEAVDAAHTTRAISWVVAGGVVAAFLGPQLGQWGRDWFISGPFVGSYLAQAVLSVMALGLLSQVRLKPVAAVAAGTARSVRELLSQPLLLTSILGAAVGYSVMTMVLTARPLAMLGCALPGESVTPVIQWHVVGMFAPSFFTGNIIKRFGAPRIMQAGFVLLLAHVAVALVLLGVGWNFAFVGGTAEGAGDQ